MLVMLRDVWTLLVIKRDIVHSPTRMATGGGNASIGDAIHIDDRIHVGETEPLLGNNVAEVDSQPNVHDGKHHNKWYSRSQFWWKSYLRPSATMIIIPLFMHVLSASLTIAPSGQVSG